MKLKLFSFLTMILMLIYSSPWCQEPT